MNFGSPYDRVWVGNKQILLFCPFLFTVDFKALCPPPPELRPKIMYGAVAVDVNYDLFSLFRALCTGFKQLKITEVSFQQIPKSTLFYITLLYS